MKNDEEKQAKEKQEKARLMLFEVEKANKMAQILKAEKLQKEREEDEKIF